MHNASVVVLGVIVAFCATVSFALIHAVPLLGIFKATIGEIPSTQLLCGSATLFSSIEKNAGLRFFVDRNAEVHVFGGMAYASSNLSVASVARSL